MAAGIGKRMQSNLPKILHKIKGESMIIRLLKQIIKLNPNKILIVVGINYNIIKNEIEKYIDNNNNIKYIFQKEPLGTGDAVKCTLSEFINDTITNIILNGDVPLLQYHTIKKIYDHYLEIKSNFLVTSINLENPIGNGRIIMNPDMGFKEIIEEKDCTKEQLQISLINCGIYICESNILVKFIPHIECNNVQKEYYLTDLVKIYKNLTNKKIDLYILESERKNEIYNINTIEQLQFAEQLLL